MQTLSPATLRALSKDLVEATPAKILKRSSLENLSRKYRLAEGMVVGVARDLQIEIEQDSKGDRFRDAPRASSKSKDQHPVSDVVRRQILRGAIFKFISSSSEELEGPEKDKSLVVAIFGNFRRERDAIRKWVTWQEEKISGLEEENTALKVRIAKLEASGGYAKKPTLTDEEIARSDPHSFFKDPRDG